MPYIDQPQFTSTISSTNHDGMLEDQYCMYKNQDGMYCDAWLGYAYPSNYCQEHRS